MVDAGGFEPPAFWLQTNEYINDRRDGTSNVKSKERVISRN